MRLLRELRTARGLSQRALAERADLSFRGLQLLESDGHDARLSSLTAVASALGLPPSALERALAAALSEDPESLYCASLRIVRDGESSWRTHLYDAVDAIRRARRQALLERAPTADLPARVAALFACVAETLCVETGLLTPAWAAVAPGLPEPWFVSGFESLRASALVESPLAFRARNVFVLANFLSRA